VYAGILFARKKTNESISMTLATLHGAATMNSTLALSIFMAIIYARGLEWNYTAETITVCTVVVLVALQGAFRKNIFLWQALLVLALYPGAILMVWTLQHFGLE
jgi:Ca2+/Na+ antiporter